MYSICYVRWGACSEDDEKASVENLAHPSFIFCHRYYFYYYNNNDCYYIFCSPHGSRCTQSRVAE